MSCTAGCRCGIDRNCPGYGNSMPTIAVGTMTFKVLTSSKSGKIDSLVKTSGSALDPLDILYAYSLLCTGITEKQAEELNEAHVHARERIQKLRTALTQVIANPNIDESIKEQLRDVLENS